ncbi:MAG: hypothetical protein ACRDJC_01885 [Thermomicrobiales bacterium]
MPTAPYRLGLVRLTLEPGAAMPELFSGGPVLLLVESGALMVRVDGPATIHRSGGDGGAEREETAAGEFMLASGDRLALAADTGYELRTLGNETAVVLSAAALAGDGGMTNRWVRARTLDEVLFTAMAPESVARANEPTAWPLGVRGALLADGVITANPPTAATLGLARLTLQPHAALPIHHVRGAEVLAVEAGTAIVDVIGGDGAMLPRPDAILASIWPHGGSSARDPRIVSGGGAVLQPGASVGVRNLGDGPLVLLILTLEPEPAPR